MAQATNRVIDFDRSAISRYIQLSTLFRRRIETGYWHVGQQIPTVDALAAEFCVARATIRQALTILEQDGLIERFRAKGTFVIYRPQQKLWCTVQSNWAGLLSAQPDADIEVLSQEADAEPHGLMHEVGTAAPAYWHLRRRHFRDGSAFLVTDIYIDQRLRSRVSKEALRTRSSMRLIAEVAGVKVKDARQTLTIGTADSETAELLSIPLNAPVALVHRSAVDDKGCLVFVGIGVYRGDVVRLDVQLK